MAKFSPSSSESDAVEAAAASWLARRDRGMDAPEEAAFREWLIQDPRHLDTVARLEKTWSALDRLATRRMAAPAAPDRDLLAPRRRAARWIWAPLLAAAAAVVFLLYPARTPVATAQPARAIIHPGPERRILDDGSVAELNQQAEIEVQFTSAERRVHLVRGQAHFLVAKNPARPFIVSAGQVAVRAVGTAFSVDLRLREISVLVTEGKVSVDEFPSASSGEPVEPRPLSALVAGQQGVIALRSSEPAEMKVTELSPIQLDRAMAWEGLRLEFVAMPLNSVAANFNRYNHRKLVVRDDATAAILVGGIFRADNVDGFIRLLKIGFGVSAFPAGDEIILRKD